MCKHKLLNCGIISVVDTNCVTDCEHSESTQHLFLECDTFAKIWQQVRFWIGVSGVDHYSLRDHFVQFTNCLGASRARRSFLQLLWLLFVWCLASMEWVHRLFDNFHTPNVELIEKVKFHSYWWLKANNATFVFGCQQWWSDPLACLGIDWLSIFVIVWLKLCF